MFKFEKLNVWQSARIFIQTIYKLSQQFPSSELYGLTSQIRRAAVSVALNIAEGCNSGSNKEFNRFLYLSSRSLDEVISCLYLAMDLEYIQKTDFDVIYQAAENLGKQISGLKRFLAQSVSL
ncbi:MAG: four helix bundle protein [Patescibacteria group bacterium]|jgi:four helix bundle protein